KKSDAAFEMIREVNPAVFLDVQSEFIDEDFESFIKGADLVADCLGGLEYRGKLKSAAAKLGIPLVTASVAGWAGVVSTVFPGDISPADFLALTMGLRKNWVLLFLLLQLLLAFSVVRFLRYLAEKKLLFQGKL
ncbi:ThiF family adenylyltransferase, partial [Aduncisulcus paluster]